MRIVRIRRVGKMGAVGLSTLLAILLETSVPALRTLYGLRLNPEWLQTAFLELPASTHHVAKFYGVVYLVATCTSVVLRKWPVIAVSAGTVIVVVSKAVIVAFVDPATPFARHAVPSVDPGLFLQPLLIGICVCSVATAVATSAGADPPDSTSPSLGAPR